MTEMYESGRKDARPNFVSYVSLINALVSHKDEDSAERAEHVLFQMYDQYKAQGNNDVRPNARLIAQVMDCWSKSGASIAGERAEALLDWMVDVYRNEKVKEFLPNEYVFSSGKN